MKRLFTLVTALACTALLGACGTLYPEPRVKMSTTPVVDLPLMPPQASTSGSIYQAASYRPLFEDNRARLVGDTLTVVITENINASQTSSSNMERANSIAAGITALPSISANSFANGRASVGTSSDIKHAGTGANANVNTFTGTITAVVTAVLPNGHLMITAEKQIGVNHNVDVLRFSGQVDPRAIGQGNSIPSTLIANVRIEQRGQGAFADANGIGWLSRFFLNLLPG